MIAKGAAKPILLLWIPSAIALAYYLFSSEPIVLWFALIFLSLPLFSLTFFRDPEREIVSGIVSPADGTVVDVTDSSFDIFMSVTNVHVNRSPESGEIVSVKHKPGGHRPAYSEDHLRNEQLEIIMENMYGRIRLVQFAGIFARRIVPYISPGDRLTKGQRIGLIRFGSRVKVELPPTAKLTIGLGDKVRAGESKVGEWR